MQPRVAAEQRGEHRHGQEIPDACGEPAPFGDGPAATGDDAMQVRMEREVAPPGVQHGRDTEQPAKALRVEAELDERGACRRERRVEDDAAIELRHSAQLLGQGEDPMKIRDRQ